MGRHIHADLMTLYAEDAQETETPWERWEYQVRDGGTPAIWRNLIRHPGWHPLDLYRQKPPTIEVNGIPVPPPVKEIPEGMWNIHIADPTLNGWSQGYGLQEHCFPLERYLSRGMVHLDKDSAIKHAKAMIFIDWRERAT